MSDPVCNVCGGNHYANFCPMIKGSNYGVPVEVFYANEKYQKQKGAFYGNMNGKNGTVYKSPK